MTKALDSVRVSLQCAAPSGIPIDQNDDDDVIFNYWEGNQCGVVAERELDEIGQFLFREVQFLKLFAVRETLQLWNAVLFEVETLQARQVIQALDSLYAVVI